MIETDQKRIFHLVHAEARRRCAQYAQEAPDGTVVKFGPPVKSREQEELYHADIGEIAEQFTHLNRRLDLETWKRLLVDQFRRDTMDDPELGQYWKRKRLDMIPSLDGCAIVVLGEQTRKFPKYVASAFIEWLKAWKATQNTCDVP